jgi:pyridoxine 4-dehydrogenase
MPSELTVLSKTGVSNYGVGALRACHAKLSQRGIKLATNQIQMSLLYRWPIENGLLDVCKELDVRVLSYSPLALGFLTGKYGKDKAAPSGPRSKIAEQLFQDDAFEQLMTKMDGIAKKHDASSSQVALNWAISKGTIPIPGARNLKQVKQNLACLDWTLGADEVKLLDEASSKVTGFITPDKNPFPREDRNTGLKMYDS